MEIILVEKVEKLGDIGDIVKVKNGYGRNFLLRQNKALRATEDNKKVFEAQKKNILARNESVKVEAKKTFDKINNKQVIVLTQASDEGRLFGSIRPKDIAIKLSADNKIEVKKSQIVLAESIRKVGVYPAKVRIHADYLATVNVNIARSEKEAQSNLVERAKESAEASEENPVESSQDTVA